MSSVLETIYVMFKANSSDLKKGSIDAEKTVNETVKNIKGKLAGFAAGIAAAAAAFTGMQAAAHTSDKLGELSQALGANVEDLSAWGDAVQMSGGTIEGFQGTVSSMTAALVDFATKGTSRAAPFFDQLKIKMVDAKGKARSFIDILPEIADAFGKISKAESLGIGQKMGLDIGTIMLLQQGRKEVDALITKQKELGVITKKDTEIAAKFNDAWDDVKHVFRSFFVEANGGVLPVLTTILKTFTNLAKIILKNKAILTGLIVTIAAVAAAFFPITAIVLGIGAAFSLIADDIDHYKRGQESLIGYLMEKYPQLGAVIKGVLDNSYELGSYLTKNLLASINNVGGAIFDLAEYLIRNLVTSIKTVADAIVALFSAVGLGGSKTKATIDTNAAITSASNSPINGISSQAITNKNSNMSKNTSVNVGDINIQTQSTDSKGIGDYLGKSLSEQIRQAINTEDDGVAA